MGLKDFFKKLKEDNKNFGKTMKRINSVEFCGNVNRGIKAGDFWEGSYVNIEEGNCVIYGSSQDDYIFNGSDIDRFELAVGVNATVSKGNENKPALRYMITFKDGKIAQADILVEKIDVFTKKLGY